MSKTGLTFRYIFFCLFFAIGVASMAFSFIAPELRANYESIDQLHRIEVNNEKLKRLIHTYEIQIEMTKTDPDVLKRLQQKILGIEIQEDDVISPYTSPEFLSLAQKALKETETRTFSKSKYRILVEQVSDERIRMGLFYSGAALILISFIFFGVPNKTPPQKTKDRDKHKHSIHTNCKITANKK